MTRMIDFTRLAVILMLLARLAPAPEAFGQQRVQYTQYMFDGLIINPAYAGAEGPLSMTFIQRSQWAGVDGAPSTQTLSAHSLFKEKQMGLGMTIVNDRIGIHKNLNALINYAYHLNLGQNRYFSMGLQAGVQNRRSDYLTLMGDLNNDPNLGNPHVSGTSFDFGAGVYLKLDNFHAGLSVPQIVPETLNMNDSVSLRFGNANYFLFLKYRLPLNDVIDLEPSALLKYVNGLPFSFDLNVNVAFYKVLTTGVSFRRQESIDLILKAQVTPQLQFGYAYDHPIAAARRVGNGSHEVMVSYLFKFVQSGINSPR